MAILTKKSLIESILNFDADEIHEACEAVGHSTDWTSFRNELKSYSIEDMQRLLKELEGDEPVSDN